jgi:hypothetical protein
MNEDNDCCPVCGQYGEPHHSKRHKQGRRHKEAERRQRTSSLLRRLEGDRTNTFVMLRIVGAIETRRAADAADALPMTGVLDCHTFTGGAERGREVDSGANGVERVMEREERDRLDVVNVGCDVSLDDGLYEDEIIDEEFWGNDGAGYGGINGLGVAVDEGENNTGDDDGDDAEVMSDLERQELLAQLPLPTHGDEAAELMAAERYIEGLVDMEGLATPAELNQHVILTVHYPLRLPTFCVVLH